MIVVVFISFALLLGAVTAAMTIAWRRWASEPVRVEARIEGPTCYPRVKR